jgi:hypothetical protein
MTVSVVTYILEMKIWMRIFVDFLGISDSGSILLPRMASKVSNRVYA